MLKYCVLLLSKFRLKMLHVLTDPLLTTGLLPRPDGEEWEKPLPYPKPKGDKWTKKKALFGQNDYIGKSKYVLLIYVYLRFIVQ